MKTMNDEEYLVKAQEILMKLLLEFDRVCQKYNLKYYLICGSLIGAVRHKTLIPWDDDADVAMTREDFDILKKHAKEEWSGGDFLFLEYDDFGSGTFLDFVTRLVYMKEEVPNNAFKKVRGKGRTDIDNHIPIDIYIMDNAADDEKKHQRMTKIIQGLYGLGMGHRAKIDYSEYSNRDEKIQKTVKILSTCGKFIPLKLIFAIYEYTRKKYNNRDGKDYIQSNGWIYCIPMRFKKELFGTPVRLPVSGEMICAPQLYEEYLTMFYGDYMQIPPEESRKPTHGVNSTGIFG